MEYCILSKLEMNESGDELDEVDLMIVEEFKSIGSSTIRKNDTSVIMIV